MLRMRFFAREGWRKNETAKKVFFKGRTSVVFLAHSSGRAKHFQVNLNQSINQPFYTGKGKNRFKQGKFEKNKSLSGGRIK